MSTTADPRPLTGEPVSLDLLNTRWNREGVTQDLLTDTEGLAVWLAANGLDFPADDAVLLHAREDGLECRIEASSAGQLDALKGAVARHLDRFAFRESPLSFDWRDQ